MKIRVDDNLGTTQKMAPEIYRAVIDEAHRRRLRVAAHVFYLADAKSLLDAGADFIAHSVRDAPVDDAFVAMLKRRNVCYCPTLMREVSTFVYESTPSWFADPFFLKHADMAAVERVAGKLSILRKPFDIAALGDAVNEALEGAKDTAAAVVTGA